MKRVGAFGCYLVNSEGRWSTEKTDLEEYPTHAVSSEDGGTVLRPWIGIWLVITLSLEGNNVSRTRKATLQNLINTHNHQCNGIHRPTVVFKKKRSMDSIALVVMSIKDYSRLRSREIKGLLRTHRLVCVCMCVCVCIYIYTDYVRFQVALAVKNPPAHAREAGLIPGLGRWRKCHFSQEEMATHFSILPGESHGQRRLVGYSP